MKRYIRVYLFLMLSPLMLFSKELKEEPQSTITSVKIKKEVIIAKVQESSKENDISSIATLIEQVKIAKAEDRRELMNQLKVQLRAMNKEKREETMRELKHSFTKHGQGEHQHQRQRQNLHQNQFRHQPQYRQLQRGHGQRGGRK